MKVGTLSQLNLKEGDVVENDFGKQFRIYLINDDERFPKHIKESFKGKLVAIDFQRYRPGRTTSWQDVESSYQPAWRVVERASERTLESFL